MNDDDNGSLDNGQHGETQQAVTEEAFDQQTFVKEAARQGYEQPFEQAVDTETPPSPYTGVPYYPEPPKPQRHVWPWVLLGVGIGFILATVVFLAYSSILVVGASLHQSSTGSSSSLFDGSSNGSSDDSSDGISGDSMEDDFFDDSYHGAFTPDELKSYAEDLPNTSTDGVCSAGFYLVGEDIEPGRYYFSGSQTEEGLFYTFSLDANYFKTKLGIVYFGNYYIDLEDGDAILFYGYGASHEGTMQLASQMDPLQIEPPYESGCYLVGTDIPAGTYAITVQSDYTSIESSDDPAAYVMDDLEFDDDSIVDTKYVISGSNQLVTVTDGQYLELYLACASPVDE